MKSPPSSLKKSLHLLGMEKRSRWMLLIAVALVASGIEMLGAALVFALLGLVSDGEAAIDLPIAGEVRGFFDIPDDAFLLATVAVMAIFFLVRSIVHVFKVYVQNRVVQNAGARLSTRLVEGYLSLPYTFHLRRSSSDIIRNAHQAVDELTGRVYMPLIVITAESVLVLGMLSLLLVLAPGPTFLAILVIGVAAVVLLYVVQPRLKKLGQRAHEMRRETLNTLQQSLHGIRDVKLLGRERAFARSFGRSRMSLAHSNYMASTAHSLPPVVMELALLGVILSVLGASVAAGTATQDAMPVLGLFAYAGLRLQPSLHKIIGGANNLKYASAPLDDIFGDMKQIESLPDMSDGVDRLPFSERLVMNGVSFRYEGADTDALCDVELEIRPGEVVGICGATGGGKSTLVDLIAGLLTPTVGDITVDGRNLHAAARNWQANLGVVSQMPYLTDQTFRENIALGMPSDQIDLDAVNEAVQLAQLEGFVRSLPEGLETVVGERGVRVSGGQRQRIAIARALYRNPSVLILDEGTSALDNTTERELIAALDRLRGERTILMVAHRLSSVMMADRIIYVEDGRVTGVGTYEELVQSHLGFRKLTATSCTPG